MPTLDQIAAFLDGYFEASHFPDDPPGLYRPAAGPVRRLGLALEPWPGLADWVHAQRLDAVFLHRPFKLAPNTLPPQVGVFCSHLAFDERLTLGYNPRLADALGLTALEVLGHKDERPLGMIGQVSPQELNTLRQSLVEIFGGVDSVSPHGAETITRLAVVGAMNEALIRDAFARGADTYLTGQWRHPAAEAVQETGLGVVAIGHRRSEEWGLRALAGVLRERWSTLNVVYSSPR